MTGQDEAGLYLEGECNPRETAGWWQSGEETGHRTRTMEQLVVWQGVPKASLTA